MAKKKTVALLFGGRSVEHAVSVNSARNIAENLDKKRFDLLPIGISKKGKWYLTNGVNKDVERGEPLGVVLDPTNPALMVLPNGKRLPLDVIFPVLHGTDGEDGSIQGLIKTLDVPMVGTGVLGSSMAMNKIIAKRLLHAAGLPVTRFVSFNYSDWGKMNYSRISKTLGVPFMVKSASLGSSVGVSKVRNRKEFNEAVEEAFKYDDELLVEQYIEGREIECAILGNYPPKASNPGEIVISKEYEFYTFDAKYVDPKAVEIKVPAKLPRAVVTRIRNASVRAFETLHCEDFARIDLFLDKKGNIHINEINTIPGFTNSSMYPVMWKERGIGFAELVTRLLNLAQERYDRRKRIERDFKSSLKF